MAQYTYSLGKKKTASAQVKLFQGKGESTINGKPLGEYISRSDLFDTVFAPLKLCKLDDKTYFIVEVQGSGESSQAAAIAHGLSRALAESDAGNRPVLKSCRNADSRCKKS